MFSKAFITSLTVLVFVVFFSSSAHAQLLSTSENSAASSVTIGTTTHNILFPQTTLRSAQSRLQDILYYLRNFDSSAALDTTAIVASTTPTTANVYSDIANFAFDEEKNTTRSIDVINDVINSAEQECRVFTGSFDIGSRANEVRDIQRFLNRFPETRIAELGPGSPGNETDYFGSLTFAAVLKFQSQYAVAILAPLGLQNPTGYWGAASRVQANILNGCSE